MTNRAAALQYNGELPRVLASARGFMAEKIVEIAKENGITVFRDADLAEVLTNLSPGEYIPEELFKAVAEVLAYCYKINDGFHDKMISRGIK